MGKGWIIKNILAFKWVADLSMASVSDQVFQPSRSGALTTYDLFQRRLPRRRSLKIDTIVRPNVPITLFTRG